MAREAVRCFKPYAESPQDYAMAARMSPIWPLTRQRGVWQGMIGVWPF